MIFGNTVLISLHNDKYSCQHQTQHFNLLLLFYSIQLNRKELNQIIIIMVQENRVASVIYKCRKLLLKSGYMEFSIFHKEMFTLNLKQPKGLGHGCVIKLTHVDDSHCFVFGYK
jgi:hypothetical protein